MIRLMIDDQYETMPWDALDAVVFDVGNVLLTFNPDKLLTDLHPDDPALRATLMERMFRSPYWVMLDHGTLTSEEAAVAMAGRDEDLRPIITQMLELDGETSNRLYGYAESVFAMGALCGGAGAGLFTKRIKAKHGYLLLLYDGLTLIPIGQAIYGGLFEVLGKRIFLLFFAAMLLTGMLALLLKRIFQKLEALLE